ncbi:MAG: hypothetical protein HY922_08340 [Elusimicrobia bacterium]|nr:hypothetical protein [Elusimicrobiota bacterium]
MISFEHKYLLDQTISHNLLAMVRTLGEFKGRQDLYREQSPQMLETLKKSAMVESVESSNRIEGVTMEAKHDLRPWWSYFLGTLIAAYKEFEERVGAITTARGAKRTMVEQAVTRLPDRFRFSEIQRACPGVSYPTLKRALAELKRKKMVRCMGRGRDAGVGENRITKPLIGSVQPEMILLMG